ncbi:M48 family metallopeptidase [Dokdonella sp.]|uniref:M48 family metallopeptidase n=1 Tax=Dokdonella sp. TaxID=2291710 RepID=UPI003C480160
MNLESENSYLELPTPTGKVIRVQRLCHPRARRMRLTVTSAGARVTYPVGTHTASITAFLRIHGEWLERKLGELKLGDRPAALKPGIDTQFPLRGEMTRLVWKEGPYPCIEHAEDRLVLILPNAHRRAQDAARGLLKSWLDAQLRKDVSRWLGRYCPLLGMSPTALRVRPLKSLWGSLDTRDRVTLDLALALAPPAVLKYVLVHELCHLRVRSHSPRFWKLVESFLPHWREQRDWLRANGPSIKSELDRLVNANAA